MIELTKTPLDAGNARAQRHRVVAVFIVAFLAWFLTNVDQSIFGYAIPDLCREFGVGIPAIGLVISASFLLGIVVPIGIGMLTDLWGARLTLPLCLGVSALLVGVQGISQSFPQFAAARIVGFGMSAALSPITNAMISGAAPPRMRAILIAILQCGYPLGWFAASLFVAPLIAGHGWRLPFSFGFIVVPIAICLGLAIPRKPAADRSLSDRRGQKGAEQKAGSSDSRPLQMLFSQTYRKTALLCGLAFFFYAGAVAATAFFLPTFLNQVRGYSVPAAALVVGCSYGVSILGYIGSALVSLYLITRRDTIVVWNCLAALLFLAMVWLPRSYAQDVIAFSLTAIFFYGTAAVMITYLLESFPQSLQATAAATCGTACISAAMVAFPLLTAHLQAAFGWQVTFSIVVAPALLLSGLTMLFLPRQQQLR